MRIEFRIETCEIVSFSGVDEKEVISLLKNGSIKEPSDLYNLFPEVDLVFDRNIYGDKVVEATTHAPSIEAFNDGGKKIADNLSHHLPDTIRIVWSVDDVLARAKDMEFYLSLDDAREILNDLKENYDSEYGLTWVTIDEAIRDHGDTKVPLNHETMMEIVSEISDILLRTRYVNIDVDVESADAVEYTEEGQRLYNELYDLTEDIVLSIVSDDGTGRDDVPTAICEKIVAATTNDSAIEKSRVEELMFLYAEALNVPAQMEVIENGEFDINTTEYAYLVELNEIEWRQYLSIMHDRGIEVEYDSVEDVYIFRDGRDEV